VFKSTSWQKLEKTDIGRLSAKVACKCNLFDSTHVQKVVGCFALLLVFNSWCEYKVAAKLCEVITCVTFLYSIHSCSVLQKLQQPIDKNYDNDCRK